MPHRPIEIDLTGPNGNVFYLIAVARNLGKQLNFQVESADVLTDLGLETPESFEEWITTEMMSSDYEHAVETFDKYFGHLVTLYR